jgi:hypothetical protein
MESPLVVEALKTMGVAGAIIFVLMGVIAVLSTIIVFMYQRANKIYGYRLKERDTLTTALSNSVTATKDHTRAMEDRSNALRELATAIKEQSGAFETLHDRVKMQYEFLNDELKRHSLVITAISEAHRVLSGMASDGTAKIDAVRVIAENIYNILNRNRAMGRGERRKKPQP